MAVNVRIDQAKSAFTKMFNGGRYSRFTLQPEEEGGGHVEVKLSNDLEEDHAPSAPSGESQGSPSYRPHPQDNYRKVCYLAVGTLLLFIMGYLVGYVSHRSPRILPINCDVKVGGTDRPVTPQGGGVEQPVTQQVPQQEELSLDWNDITNLLQEKVTSETFNKRLSEFEAASHRAGSDGDRMLANKVFHSFETLEMNPWTDTLYVPLPAQDSERPNRVLIGSEEVGRPKGYLAYSPTGSVQGRVVYGNYGRVEDLEELKEQQQVEVKDSVMLLRAGRLSFAQQVSNAAAVGASAVLIYPDPQEQDYQDTTELYGHVHLGSGDPYTPGFPSFNHTQFPPSRSSGLPSILAQTITAQTAIKILAKMGGKAAPSHFQGGLKGVTYTLDGAGDGTNVTVEVNNVAVNTEIHNVFGVVKGFTDPDRYVVLGAQRDSWGPGFATATVGTSLLMELARALSEMVENEGFRPKRSLVFASWAAGEYGNVGATEWLEGYLSSIDKKALAYISLDGVVTGHGKFEASASPLLHSLLGRTMREVKNPIGPGQAGKSLYEQVVGSDILETAVLRPMLLEDPAYTFLAFSGIPSLSFTFKSDTEYPYYGTSLDSRDHLGYAAAFRVAELASGAGQLAGRVALRLAHDHVLPLDTAGYKMVLSQAVRKVNLHLHTLSQAGQLGELTARWLNMALGSYSRAAADLEDAVRNTDLADPEACRILNDRIMGVEHSLLSPYLSPVDAPYRHLLFGRGDHTLASLVAESGEELHTQLALATWTLQGVANGLVGNVWDLDNQI